MALLNIVKQNGKADMGQNGRLKQWGSFSFSTTDTSGELPVNMRAVESAKFSFASQPATDEEVYVSETLSNGVILVPATGSITIARVAGSPTSGLKCFYEIIGY